MGIQRNYWQARSLIIINSNNSNGAMMMMMMTNLLFNVVAWLSSMIDISLPLCRFFVVLLQRCHAHTFDIRGTSIPSNFDHVVKVGMTISLAYYVGFEIALEGGRTQHKHTQTPRTFLSCTPKIKIAALLLCAKST
jgi:hypothetical protein